KSARRIFAIAPPTSIPTWPPYPPRKPLWTHRPGGPDWMPITPKTGSLFHAYSHYATSQERRAALAPWLDHYNTERPHAALAHHPPAARLHQSQLLCSIEGAVASSRPNSNQDCSVGPGQGSPEATGVSRRAASLRRTDAAVTLAQGGTLA